MPSSALQDISPPAETATEGHDELVRLGREHGTDKVGHRYLERYASHLGALRGEQFSLLEIGVYKGASLRMFRDFFPRAQVVGLDIKPVEMADEPRITIHQGSQADVALLRRIDEQEGPFQVVIDDGSHVMAHLRTTFATMFPLLADGGWYIVEDLSTSYWEEYGGGLPGRTGTAMSMLQQLVDGLNWDSWLPAHDPPSYTDFWIDEIHFYRNVCFLRKGKNAGRKRDDRVGAMRFRDLAGA